MNIVIVGYGRMGHEIESLLVRSGTHTITAIAAASMGDELQVSQLTGADVAIDFSAAECMPAHIDAYCKAGINAVIGTTGWTFDEQKLERAVGAAGNCIIIGTNFSAGVQTFLAIVRLASRRFNALGGFDVFGHEAHHSQKADSPSGTAKTLASVVLEEMDDKKSVIYGNVPAGIAKDQLQIVSQRGGSNPGMHSVVFENNTDRIELTHQAFSREGFAQGAIDAAEVSLKRKGLIRYEALFNEGELYGSTI